MQAFTTLARLTRDPEIKPAGSNGNSVALFGIAIPNRVLDSTTNTWVDKAVFIDCEAWDGSTGRKLATFVQEHCRKGFQFLFEGKLKLDQWTDKTTNQPRQKHKVVITAIHFTQPKPDGGVPPGYAPPAAAPGYGRQPAAQPARQPAGQPPRQPAAQPPRNDGYTYGPPDDFGGDPPF